jgi:DNA-binding CsgD family transcriptional regulator
LSRIRQWAGAPATVATEGCTLTSRQVDVVRLAVSGKTAKQSARCLGLSVRTVEGYRAQARERAGVASIGELIAWAVAEGIVSTGRTSFEAQNEGRELDEGRSDTPLRTIMFRNGEISEHDRGKNGSTLVEGRQQRRGRPTAMSADRIIRAREMLATHTVKEVAAKLGVSRGTLYAHMREIRAAGAAASQGASM